MERNDGMHRWKLILAVLLPLAASAQPKETTVIFEQTQWNFGTIQETDGKVSHTFRYTNSGNSPLLFYSADAGCGCTIPTYRKEPLKAGESADFIVTYDPTNRPGRFEKYVVIQGNMEGGNIVIKISGIVEPRPRGIEDDYPIILGKGIRLADSQLDAGAVANTRSGRMTVKFYNSSDKSVKVGFAKEGVPSWLALDKDTTAAPGSPCVLGVEFRPDAEMWGHRSYSLPIVTDGQRQPIEILVSADFTEDFSALTPEQKSRSPYIILSSYFYSFSDCKAGEKLVREFTVMNKGKGTLEIRYLDYDNSKMEVSVSGKSIPAGETAKLTVTVDSSRSRDIAEVVRVISNDPLYPVREIRIIANIL